MAFILKQLRGYSDEQLIQMHDEIATNTVVDISYYLDELRRREQRRAIRASNRLAVAAVVLAMVNAVVGIVLGVQSFV